VGLSITGRLKSITLRSLKCVTFAETTSVEIATVWVNWRTATTVLEIVARALRPCAETVSVNSEKTGHHAVTALHMQGTWDLSLALRIADILRHQAICAVIPMKCATLKRPTHALIVVHPTYSLSMLGSAATDCVTALKRALHAPATVGLVLDVEMVFVTASRHASLVSTTALLALTRLLVHESLLHLPLQHQPHRKALLLHHRRRRQCLLLKRLLLQRLPLKRLPLKRLPPLHLLPPHLHQLA